MFWFWSSLVINTEKNKLFIETTRDADSISLWSTDTLVLEELEVVSLALKKQFVLSRATVSLIPEGQHTGAAAVAVQFVR